MRALVALLLLGGIALADESSFIFKLPGPRYLIIHGQVSINLENGSMTFEPGYSPDGAARQFWEAMSEDYRRMLRWKAAHPEVKE